MTHFFHLIAVFFTKDEDVSRAPWAATSVACSGPD
jgi:hypothetical protein